MFVQIVLKIARIRIRIKEFLAGFGFDENGSETLLILVLE